MDNPKAPTSTTNRWLHPGNLNIATQNHGFGKVTPLYSFQTWPSWISILNFRGVCPPISANFVLAIYQGFRRLPPLYPPFKTSQVFGWRRLSALWANATEATHAHRGGVGGYGRWGRSKLQLIPCGRGGGRWRKIQQQGFMFFITRIPVIKGGMTKINIRS